MLKRYLAYIKDNPEGHWFKRKLYGWGWTPATWQGWLVTGVYLALLLAFAATIDERSPPEEVMFTFVLPAFFLTLAFLRIVWDTGESPRWQWGFPKDTDNK